MGRAIRRGALATVAVAVLAGAAPAAAATFFVSTTGTDASNGCQTQTTPCLTIAHAVASSEVTPGLGTIELAPGTYATTLALTSISDFGLTIAGTGASPAATVIQGPLAAGQATIAFGAGLALGSLSLSNLSVVNPVGNTQRAISGAGGLSLTGVDVTVADPTNTLEAISDNLGPVTLAGSSVTIDGTGDGVTVDAGPLTVNNSSVTLANSGGSANGLADRYATTIVNGSTIATANGGDGVLGLGPVTVSSSAFAVNGPGSAVVAQDGAATLTGDTVTLNDAASTAAAVEAQAGDANVSDSTIGGTWHGPGIVIQGGGGSVAGSTVSTNASGSTAPAVSAAGQTPSDALLLARDRLVGNATATPGTVEVRDADLVVDSSLILGGTSGITYAEQNGKANTATIDSSTIDAGVLGTGPQAGISAVAATAAADHSATVAINGSILLQAPSATVSTGGTAGLSCSYSDLPSTTQAESATLGAIGCASGANGNTSSPAPSLFAPPLGTGYQLLAGSAAVDSVPASAVSLPDGFAASPTDLAGNRRTVDGTGDCVAVRDRGAFELQGHAGANPAPTITGPPSAVTGTAATFGATVRGDPSATLAWRFSDGATATGASVTHVFAAAGTATATVTATGSPATCTGSASAAVTVVAPAAITELSLSPARFRPARAGVSTATKRSHNRGTVISYTDSEASTVTFTVEAVRNGRLVGSTCLRATRHNRRRAPCTYSVRIGTFSHTDTAGVNTFVFTGRIDGRALGRGSYQLQAIPSNANGAGAALVRSFTIGR